jgi:hypothetical protein
MMNKERIKELYYRAGIWANNQIPFTNHEWVNMRDSKFAELIVQECVHTVRNRGGMCGVLASNWIEEHFGVEL